MLGELTWVVKEFTGVLQRRRKKCFYSLSKGGKGPDAYSGIGPDAWVFESFTEFKEQSVGKSR